MTRALLSLEQLLCVHHFGGQLHLEELELHLTPQVGQLDGPTAAMASVSFAKMSSSDTPLAREACTLRRSWLIVSETARDAIARAGRHERQDLLQ